MIDPSGEAMIDLDATPCCPAYGCGGALHRHEQTPAAGVAAVFYACEDCERIVEWDWPADEHLTWHTVSRYFGTNDIPSAWYDRLVAVVEWFQAQPTEEALMARVRKAEADAHAAREELRRLKCDLAPRW